MSYIAAPLRTLAVPVADLREDPKNARKHPGRNLDAIVASFRRFGQRKPIVVQRDGMIVRAGNGALLAARQLGWSHLAATVIDESSAQAIQYAVADNRSAELAEWDNDILGELMVGFDEATRMDLGFLDHEFRKLIAGIDESNPDINDPGAGAPPTVPVARMGDLWCLGDHRLMCGDSTKPEEIARLMGGNTAHLLATDPPYLVDYTAGNPPPSSVNRPETANKGWDAYKDPETSVDFFDAYLRACLPHVVPDAAIYQWHATRRQSLVEQAWEKNGLLIHQTIIWCKKHAVLTRSMFMWRHEPCFMGWVQGNMPPLDRRPPHNETTVWEIDQAGEDRPDHPTPKPLEIFERPLQYHTRPGEIALEPFSGSGSQIIAAEKLRRRCFAMELAPAFVDVAIRRWQTATGRSASLADDGRTFEQVEADRREDPALA